MDKILTILEFYQKFQEFQQIVEQLKDKLLKFKEPVSIKINLKLLLKLLV